MNTSAKGLRVVVTGAAAGIGRAKHRSGITAALHCHRTPATGALIFLFLVVGARPVERLDCPS
jgi:hypothetical protein